MKSHTIRLVSILVILLTACSQDPAVEEDNPLLGFWRFEYASVSINDNTIYELFGSAEPPYMQLWEFRTDIVVEATNQLANGNYDTLVQAYELLSEDEIISDGNLITYAAMGTALTLTSSVQEEDEPVSTTVFELVAYTGEFPPIAWLSPLPNDSYEPDDSRDSATEIIVGAEAQSHILVAYDEDWFSFAADSGTTYFIDTSEEPGTVNFSTYMELYDAISPAPFDSTNINWFTEDSFELIYAALFFSPTVHGTYFVKISTLGGSQNFAIGPYQIDITIVAPSVSPEVNAVSGNPNRLRNYFARPFSGFIQKTESTPGRRTR